jgi:hypothetical protein
MPLPGASWVLRTVWIDGTWASCLDRQYMGVLSFFVGYRGLGRKLLAGRPVWIGSTWAYCLDRQYKGVLSGQAVHGRTVFFCGLQGFGAEATGWAYCLDRQDMGVLYVSHVTALLHALHRDVWIAGWGCSIPRTGGQV